MHLVARAWADSFARKTSNQNAIAERGWTPLTYNCLLHPEILATRGRGASSDQISEEVGQDKSGKQSEVPSIEENLAAELNLSHGLSGKYMDSIIEIRIRDDARNGVNLEENRQKRKQSALDAINSKSKRYTAGLHQSAGKKCLGPDVLQNIRERQQEQQIKQSELQEKRLRAYRSLRTKVTAIKEQNKWNEQLNVAQLKVLVTWYKHAGDLPMPTTQLLLLGRLQET